MKKLIISLLIFAVLVQTVHAALPTILVESVSPQPVEPGRDLTVDVRLDNRQNTDTGMFSATFDTRWPIIVKSSTVDWSSVHLCAFCSDKNKYFLTVDPTATSGTYPVYFKTYVGSTEVRQQVDVTVQGKPNLIFTTPTQGLDMIVPNSQFSVDLVFSNIGSGQARQVRVQPESTSFIVIGGSVKTIDTVTTNETKTLTFDFASAATLDATSYSIPFHIVYLDDLGNIINSSQNLGLKVVNKGDINIKSTKITPSAGAATIIAGQPFTVIVRLENVGHGDADFIEGDVTCPFLSTAKRSFVGKLQKDEDAPAVYDMTSYQSGTFSCNINVLFKDDLGAHNFSDKFEVVVAPHDFTGTIIFLVIILVLAFIFRQRIVKILGLNKQPVPHHK